MDPRGWRGHVGCSVAGQLSSHFRRRPPVNKILAALALTVLASPAYAHTVTGTLHVAKVMCMQPCIAPVSIEVNGVYYHINTDTYFTNGELGALDGATVSLKGSFVADPGPDGTHFMTEAFEPSSDTIRIKGTLNQLYFAMGIPTFPHVGNMSLDLGNGRRLLVDSGDANWMAYNHHDVWVSGTMVKGGGDMATYLQGKKV